MKAGWHLITRQVIGRLDCEGDWFQYCILPSSRNIWLTSNLSQTACQPNPPWSCTSWQWKEKTTVKPALPAYCNYRVIHWSRTIVFRTCLLSAQMRAAQNRYVWYTFGCYVVFWRFDFRWWLGSVICPSIHVAHKCLMSIKCAPLALS